jgi:hypothetical protein
MIDIIYCLLASLPFRTSWQRIHVRDPIGHMYRSIFYHQTTRHSIPESTCLLYILGPLISININVTPTNQEFDSEKDCYCNVQAQRPGNCNTVSNQQMCFLFICAKINKLVMSSKTWTQGWYRCLYNIKVKRASTRMTSRQVLNIYQTYFVQRKIKTNFIRDQPSAGQRWSP